MDTFPLIVVLALMTFAAVAAFALMSKQAVEKRMEDDDSVKSTLAADKDSHGKPADV